MPVVTRQDHQAAINQGCNAALARLFLPLPHATPPFFFPIALYGIANGAIDLFLWYQTGNQENGRLWRDKIRLITGITLLGANSIYFYQEHVLGIGSANPHWIFISLAITSGIELLVALQTLHSQWPEANTSKKIELGLNAAVKLLLFSAWIACALGNLSAGGVLLILTLMVALGHALLAKAAYHHAEVDLLIQQQIGLPADQPPLRADDQPQGFKVFTGTPFSLGRQS
ncbi:MAG: hypothetical protein K0S27_1009 [Gammaproteobacteria bacterium]|jgi:hypothetical protein|nr:hypothetical protein [Gammaproteobacteria bacterium]